MSVRPAANVARMQEFSLRFEKQLGRLYLLWLIGIISGALVLKPDTIDLAGVHYKIENPEVIQGLIFVGCLIYFIGIIGNVVIAGIEQNISSFPLKRRMIWVALGTRRTFVGADRSRRNVIKGLAKVYLFLAKRFYIIAVFLPVAQIIFLEQQALLSGIDAVLGTASVRDGKVLLMSPVVTIGTGLLLSAWAAWIAKYIPNMEGVRKILFVSMIACLSFAWLDHIFRQRESFEQAFQRVFGIQVIIAIVCLVFGRLAG
jgi:hypothetical protein